MSKMANIDDALSQIEFLVSKRDSIKLAKKLQDIVGSLMADLKEINLTGEFDMERPEEYIQGLDQAKQVVLHAAARLTAMDKGASGSHAPARRKRRSAGERQAEVQERKLRVQAREHLGLPLRGKLSAAQQGKLEIEVARRKA